VNAFKRLVEELDPCCTSAAGWPSSRRWRPSESLTFTELRDALEMTDGKPQRPLTEAGRQGYVAIDKRFVGRRPQTTCRLNQAGRQAFANYVDHLEAIVSADARTAGA